MKIRKIFKKERMLKWLIIVSGLILILSSVAPFLLFAFRP